MTTKCKSCPDFVNKKGYANVLGGIWDFKTCHATCWRSKHLKFEKCNYDWQINHNKELAGVR
jgi:hypothetical protein